MNLLKHSTLPLWEQPESRRLEFKEEFPKGDQIARTVVAFANGAGGKIVLGVRNKPRQVVGISNEELFPIEEQISNYLADSCAPTIVPEIFIQAAKEKNLLVVEIFPGSHKPYYLKAKGKHQGTYIRIGSTNRPASQEILEELERQRRKISFDALPVYGLLWRDLDLKRFRSDYFKATRKKLANTQLENLNLLIKEHSQSYPSNAAVLLSESPHRKKLFPFAKIECARFKGVTTSVFIDQATIDLPIYLAVEECIAFIKKNIALGSTIGEVYRKNRWEYPLEAIREAVTNAIIHRDYSLIGKDIKIAIFDDMLEITSPGPLPDTMSLEDLGTGRSDIRNRVLAPIFKDMGLIEAWGTGMQKIRQANLKYPEIETVFQEVGLAFQVQFKKHQRAISKPELSADQVGTKLESSQHQVGTKSAPSWHQVGTKLALSSEQKEVLAKSKKPLSLLQLSEFLKRSDRTKLRQTILTPLLDAGLLAMTHPDKPNSPKQKYVMTLQGEELLEQIHADSIE